MNRPLRVTLLALGLGWFSFVAMLGVLGGLLTSVGGNGLLPRGLCATVFLTGALGLRATVRMWRQRADTSQAVRAFTLVGAFIPAWVYMAFPPERRGEAIWPTLLGTALFVGVGLFVAHQAAASRGAA